MIKNFFFDIKAGLVVFLIALPLSLGISLASGAPSSAGLISAIIGGLIGSYLGGSQLTINGPAAGLIVVVLSSIQNLGHGDYYLGFKRTLACLVIVGVLQIISGVTKLGRFVSFFPLSVVQGMLFSIGLIIIINQTHLFFGHQKSSTILNSLFEIPISILNFQLSSTIIGLASLIILFVYPKLKIALKNYLPAPLLAVVVSIFLAQYLTPELLVTIPNEFKNFIIYPQFDILLTYQSLLSILTLYFVASLESILSVSAVDQIDPLSRESDFNRELWSKGCVNILCGLLGGLPVIAEIVRSSANISQGARSPLSNFSHGFFILFFVLFFPSILNLIPLSSLAALLIYVGFNLADKKRVTDIWQWGKGANFGFWTTIIVTLSFDLLLGIFSGVLIEFIYFLVLLKFKGIRILSLFKTDFEIINHDNKVIIVFKNSLTFLTLLKQKKIISQYSQNKNLVVDLSQTQFIDSSSTYYFSHLGVEIVFPSIGA